MQNISPSRRKLDHENDYKQKEAKNGMRFAEKGIDFYLRKDIIKSNLIKNNFVPN